MSAVVYRSHLTTFDERQYALEHPEPTWKFGDVIAFSENAAWAEVCIVWMDSADAVRQLKQQPSYWLIVPLRATLRRANAVEYYKDAVSQLTDVSFAHVYLSPSDEWLVEHFGVDNIDNRLYSYRLLLTNGVIEAVGAMMYEEGPYMHVNMIDDMPPGRELIKRAACKCRELVETVTTNVTTMILAVTKSKVLCRRLKSLVRVVDVFEMQQGFVVRDTSWLTPQRAAVARRVLQPGVFIVVMYVTPKTVDSTLRRIRVCRRPDGVPVPTVFVGRPDINILALLATAPEDVNENTPWIRLSRCRPPRLHSELVSLALIFHRYVVPCDLVWIALQLPGMVFLKLANIDTVLQNTYKSIRAVRAKSDVPARRTRAKTNK